MGHIIQHITPDTFSSDLQTLFQSFIRPEGGQIGKANSVIWQSSAAFRKVMIYTSCTGI